MLGVSVENSAALRRVVEMYQWESYKDGQRDDGTDIIRVRRTWASYAIDSSTFDPGYTNPPMPIETENFTSSTVNLGGFYLS